MSARFLSAAASACSDSQRHNCQHHRIRQACHGELHRWMRQVGHDGRLLKSTSNRWKFLAWIHRRVCGIVGLGPGGRWAGVSLCGLARFGAFWGVRDWRAGLECGAGAVGGGWGWAALRGGSDELGQVGDVSQGGGEGVCPWPVERQGQSVAAAVVDEAARHGEEPVGDGGRDGELARGVGAAEAGGPAHEVVRKHAAGEPGAVGGEPS